MSKNIIIQQSGFPEALTVDALRTSKLGSGSEDWLPAEGKNLVELDIGGSGTYRASDYGAYGIAMARVTPKYGGGATSKAAQQPGFGNLHIPVIQEGDLPVLLSARMVKTNLQGGGTCLWVPEDEVNLDTKYVDHSGTYPASADNCYGYSQINVSGVDVEITTDDDGDDVAEITDGGETKEVKLPSSIVVVTPPAKLVYNDGELIDFHGIVVKAYTESGQLWTDIMHPNGIIPIEELVFPVTIVEAGPAEGVIWKVSDLETNWPQPIPVYTQSTVLTRYIEEAESWTNYKIARGPALLITYNSAQGHYPGGFEITYLSGEPITIENAQEEGTVGYEEEAEKRDMTFVSPDIIIDNKPVYVGEWQEPAYPPSYYGVPPHTWEELYGDRYWTSNPYIAEGTYPAPDDATKWTAIYGETVIPSALDIPVQWTRPYDDELLETTFEISVDVQSGFGGAEGGGGQAGDVGAGRDD